MAMLHTIRAGYSQLRDKDVTVSETVLDGSTSGRTFEFRDKPASAMFLGEEYNGVELYFGSGKSYVDGLTTSDATVEKASSFTIWGYADSGPAMKICDGTAQAGQSRMFRDSSDALYCCSIHIGADSHIHGVTVTDVDSTIGVAKMNFDTAGYRWLHVEFPDVSAPINTFVRPY